MAASATQGGHKKDQLAQEFRAESKETRKCVIATCVSVLIVSLAKLDVLLMLC